jgi:hypothetical protein
VIDVTAASRSRSGRGRVVPQGLVGLGSLIVVVGLRVVGAPLPTRGRVDERGTRRTSGRAYRLLAWVHRDLAKQSPHTTTVITAAMLPSMLGLAPEEQMGSAQHVLGITASSGSRRPAATV